MSSSFTLPLGSWTDVQLAAAKAVILERVREGLKKEVDQVLNETVEQMARNLVTSSQIMRQFPDGDIHISFLVRNKGGEHAGQFSSRSPEIDPLGPRFGARRTDV
jgi:hypothetical protein